MTASTLRRSLAIVLLGLPGAQALAQPADLPIAPATTASFPPGVKISGKPGDQVYADRQGRVLYGMDLRTLLRWSPDPAQYCKDDCAAQWEPLLAPAGAAVNIRYPRNLRDALPEGFVQPQAAPDWTVIAGPQGAQWVYKGWHMVFTRRGADAGSRQWDGAQNKSWNTLKYVPPVPAVAGPPGVRPLFHDGAYALADSGGRLLYTGQCRHHCEGWQAFAAPMASRGLGAWQVRHGEGGAHWALRGKPVFVASDDEPLTLPEGAKVLRP